MTMRFSVAGVGLLVALSAAARFNGAAPASAQPRPLSGFDELTDAFWDSPWVLDRQGAAVTALRHTREQTAPTTIGVRLDDDTRGTLQVAMGDCGPGDDCAPYDCGCPLENDSYWIDVTDARGQRVARTHLWAAYGRFDIVPVDLVGGPGDELVVVRIPAHASPPVGHDLKIWRIAAGRPVELIEPMKVADAFESLPNTCARWRTTLSVDLESPKPRPIALRSAFGAILSECRLVAGGAARLATLNGERILRFEQGRYR